VRLIQYGIICLIILVCNITTIVRAKKHCGKSLPARTGTGGCQLLTPFVSIPMLLLNRDLYFFGLVYHFQFECTFGFLESIECFLPFKQHCH
jgi:hypothetical protein